MDTTLKDVLNGLRALSVAMDALEMIADMGGVQGDWAADAIREVGSIVAGDQPSALQQSVWDAALGQGRN